MLVGTARKAKSFLSFSSRRSGPLCAATLLLVLSSEGLQNAVANGDTRTISLHHVHTKEDITITYKRDGRYDDDALGKLNWFVRDWRTDQKTTMDPALFDLIWELHREVGAKEPIHVIGGYRSPQTNEMLRRRSSGVARTSQHMAGRAMDFFIPGVSLEDQRIAGLRLQRGGVGYYPSSGSPFVHIDTGSIRHWPRMTHDQLARVFPDGKTVHIPSNGQPLAKYELALAEVEKRGKSPSALSRSDGVNTSSKFATFAKLLGFGKDRDEKEDDETSAISSKKLPTRIAKSASSPTAKPELTPVAVAAIPLPPVRPAAGFQLASAPAATAPEKSGRVVQRLAAAAPGTPNDVISARGFWTGLPDPGMPNSGMAAEARTQNPSAASASRRRPAPEPAATGSVGPFAAPDRVSPETALAYAAQIGPLPSRGVVAGPAASRALPPASTTVALKSNGSTPSIVESRYLPPVPGPSAVQPGHRYDEPWLRAMALTPSVERFLNATLLGMPDYRNLQPLLHAPASTVVMTFSDDPYLGMTAAQFTGSAVTFVATATFSNQTAALR